jgi:DNA-binding XRE family transcriptional regulator
MLGYAGIWSLVPFTWRTVSFGSMAASALPNTSLTTLEWVRRTAGMSRPELAERSGVSVATILASERFGRVPHLTTARLLAHTLNLAVDELLPEGEQNE